MSEFYAVVDVIKLMAKLIYDLTSEQNIIFIHEILNKYTRVTQNLKNHHFIKTKAFIRQINTEMEKGFVTAYPEEINCKEINN